MSLKQHIRQVVIERIQRTGGNAWDVTDAYFREHPEDLAQLEREEGEAARRGIPLTVAKELHDEQVNADPGQTEDPPTPEPYFAEWGLPECPPPMSRSVLVNHAPETWLPKNKANMTAQAEHDEYFGTLNQRRADHRFTNAKKTRTYIEQLETVLPGSSLWAWEDVVAYLKTHPLFDFRDDDADEARTTSR